MMLIAPVGLDAPQSRGFIAGQHGGIDYAVPVGTPIAASADGTVIYRADEPDGYGNTLTVDHGGPQTRYAHLTEFFVGQGDRVTAGQIIGLTGGVAGAPGAGNSTGPHLHYEYRTDPSTPVDPAPLLSGQPSPERKTKESNVTVYGTKDGKWYLGSAYGIAECDPGVAYVHALGGCPVVRDLEPLSLVGICVTLAQVAKAAEFWLSKV